MATLAELARDLDRALELGDLDQASGVRALIAEQHPETPAAAEARFKLGLDALFRQRDPDRAAAHLREAAKAKDARWSQQARISLGLLLLRQGKHQQAVFELRRAAAARPPTVVAAQAAGFVAGALREARQAKEAERARTEQLRLLEGLTASVDPAEAAYAHLLLGVEHKHDGQRALARKHLQAAITGGALPPAERAHAEKALREL
jgi:tetratricopeptide (TPR) repeat protein